MELFNIGFPTAFSLENLLYCFLGVFLGTFVGVLPGIGALAAVSLLLPVTFYLDPITALVMLGGVYYGTEYGGSTASILLNLPGTASNAVTCIDGYPMAQQGRAGVALFVTTIASFIGGGFGILVIMFLAPSVASAALAFGPAEYFAAMTFGLIAAATIGQGSVIRGLSMVVLGLVLGSIGADVHTGIIRYSFGMSELYDGISIIVLAMGLFGVAEVIASVRNQSLGQSVARVTLRSMIPTKADVRQSVWPVFRGSGVGSAFGALPGTGPAIAVFLSYALEKNIAKQPERFGKGAIEGIASPEASNNAAVQTAFIPTLTLGIPGSATMAVMMGALMIHGINPGPQLMQTHPELFWGLIASFWIGNVMLLVLNIPLIGIWIKLLSVPYHYLFPVVILLICVGTYSIGNSAFDVMLVLIFGILGYFMRIYGFEPAPLLIGFILGPLLEENFRRAMQFARGDFLLVVSHPIAGSILVASAILLVFVSMKGYLLRQR